MRIKKFLTLALLLNFGYGMPDLMAVPETEQKTVTIPMRDGILLSTDIHFPGNTQDKLPVILMRTPLNKENIGPEINYFVRQGYVVAIQDVRGRFASEGQWEPFVNEGEDGYDTIEWLARQTWCNGKVGMMGGSYMAWLQFLAARLNPPHLAAIIPNCVPADPFLNSPWENGIFLLAPEIWWANLMALPHLDITDPRVIRESHKIKDDPGLNTLPVSDIDQVILGRELPYWRNWLVHNTQDAYWEQASYLHAIKNITVPVLLQSGWYDTHAIGTKLAWQELSKSDDGFVKMVIGPWNHANLVPPYPSTKNVGLEANVNFLDLYRKWFDCWLKGTDNNIQEDPPVSLYVMNDKRWIHSDTYPLQETKFVRLYLGSQKGATYRGGDGKLSWNSFSGGRRFDSYRYDPADPTPAFIYRNARGRARADSIAFTRNDILVYESSRLESALTLAGPVTARIFAASTCEDTDWFVTLYAIDDADQYMPLVRGCIRARFRNSFSNPEPLRKNKIYEYVLDMWHTAIKLDKGWRIRVEIASADFPQYSRNLNTGGNNELESAFLTARQKIYCSGKHASFLILPVIAN